VAVLAQDGSEVAILAPHGGSIEPGTSEIARAIAGTDFSLYLFEGLRPAGNYETLHITSRRFDEPDCLEVLRRSSIVITIHGCEGSEAEVHIGGLDIVLARRIGQELSAADVTVVKPSRRYPGTHQMNICNRGLEGRGVQMEFTSGIRKKFEAFEIARPIRNVLLGRCKERGEKVADMG